MKYLRPLLEIAYYAAIWIIVFILMFQFKFYWLAFIVGGLMTYGFCELVKYLTED